MKKLGDFGDVDAAVDRMTQTPEPTKTCDICHQTVATYKRVCDGDGGIHHHGRVHTSLRGETNDLAFVGVECGCAAADTATWRAWPGERSKSNWPGRVSS